MKQVVAALLLKEDKILICQRTENQPHPLKWEFPGGKIEPHEEPVAALARELEEELGIRASIGRKVTTIQHNYGANNAVELHFYLVEEYQGELQNRIFRDIRWATRKELPAFDFLEADVAMVNDIASGRLELPVSR
ncbi:MAG: NUDIX hydrolase [Candidatus Angelobacter sp. Gp1-AA117]|nr:MAG: NUDIX hydrolase [Candidatus Angelobacter sp. Gp1-AA117]